MLCRISFCDQRGVIGNVERKSWRNSSVLMEFLQSYDATFQAAFVVVFFHSTILAVSLAEAAV